MYLYFYNEHLKRIYTVLVFGNTNKGCFVHSGKLVAALNIFSSSTHFSSYNFGLFSFGTCILKIFLDKHGMQGIAGRQLVSKPVTSIKYLFILAVVAVPCLSSGNVCLIDRYSFDVTSEYDGIGRH